jgi:hypothetical protein
METVLIIMSLAAAGLVGVAVFKVLTSRNAQNTSTNSGGGGVVDTGSENVVRSHPVRDTDTVEMNPADERVE